MKTDSAAAVGLDAFHTAQVIKPWVLADLENRISELEVWQSRCGKTDRRRDSQLIRWED